MPNENLKLTAEELEIIQTRREAADLAKREQEREAADDKLAESFMARGPGEAFTPAEEAATLRCLERYFKREDVKRTKGPLIM